MVSPIEKNGGEIQGFGGNFGGDVIQAAAQGGAFTYTSASSFGNAQGAPGASQYVAHRTVSGWSTDNVTPPAVAGSYTESSTSGVPYQLFSTDLLSGLVTNGRRCRDTGSSNCPVENPPLAESGAPAGYRNYYLRAGSNGSFTALLTSTDLSHLALGPEDFEVQVAGATPDFAHIVISTCAALTVGATEVPGTGGECNPAKQNLYEKSGAGALTQINTAPGATLAAQSRAISSDGSRVYWTNGTNLYLREGALNKQVDEAQGGGGTFQTASADGSVAYFTKAGHLYQYQAPAGTTTDLTPAGGVQGMLGASEDGTYVYYLSATGLFLWHSGTTTAVASQAEANSYPPTTGTARVSADGRHLAFVSSAPLTIYDNTGLDEVYYYTAPSGAEPSGTLICVSCDPSGERPLGAASLPGASPNGIGVNLPHSYKPRVLSADSNRLFFDSFDALVPQDTDNAEDVYEWEAPGSGSCTRAGGCIGLISSGRAAGGATFLDASADGSEAFFLTGESLVPSDPGAADVYDAGVGGGFPLPESVIPCFGDTCQPLPPEPEDPTPGTLRAKTSGNLPPPSPKRPSKCKKGEVKQKGKCVQKKTHRKRRNSR